jgi:hypothetical protein
MARCVGPHPVRVQLSASCARPTKESHEHSQGGADVHHGASQSARVLRADAGPRASLATRVEPRARLADAACSSPAADRTAVLRWLSDTYIQTQKLRISVENRTQAVTRARAAPPAAALRTNLAGWLRKTEEELQARMRSALLGHPAAPWLAAVHGVGPTLATKLLGQIGDIARFETVSKLWRFAGYAVVRTACPQCVKGRAPQGPCRRCAGRGWVGRRETRAQGVPASYSVKLKTTLYQVAVSLLRCRSPYRVLYDRARATYTEREATLPAAARWSRAHCHQAALRRMIKTFLGHLFVAWRLAEGLDVPQPRGRSSVMPDPWVMLNRPA